MKKITKLLILLVLTFIPVMASAKGNVTIEHKSYNKTTHVFHVDGEGTGKYTIVTLYDGSKQIAMYVAGVKDSTYNADIKITFKEAKTITIKVGDINGTSYAKSTLDVEKSTLDISKAKVTGIVDKVYNGYYQKQKNIKVTLNGKTLKEGTDYKISHYGNKNVGTAKVTITGLGNYADSKIVKTFKITKANNTLKIVTYKKSVLYSKVKSSSQVVKPITIVKRQGTMSYEKLSGSKYLTVNKTTGKVTIKKGTKKGTYTAKIKVKAAGNSNYKSAWRSVTVTIIVK